MRPLGGCRRRSRRGARDKGQTGWGRLGGPGRWSRPSAARLRLTLAPDIGPFGRRPWWRTGGGDYCLALKANQLSCCPTPGPVSASCRQTTRPRVGRQPGMAARCQRRSKTRPPGGAKVGHFGLGRDACHEMAARQQRSPDRLRLTGRLGPSGRIRRGLYQVGLVDLSARLCARR